MQGARRAHIHWPIFNRLGGAKLGEDHRATPQDGMHRHPNAEVFLGQDTRMPANLPPVYHTLEKELRQAKDPQTKLEILEEMLSVMPKHKGTDRLQADVKRRIAKLRAAGGQTKAARRTAWAYRVERQGAGQVLLVGPANAGKSQLLTVLTNARPEVAPYPYTTTKPVPGMMRFENVHIQLVDTPPLGDGAQEWIGSMVRRAAAVVLVLDGASPELLDRADECTRLLAHAGVDPLASPTRPCLVVVNKLDSREAEENLPLLEEWFQGKAELLRVSAESGAGLDALKLAIYQALDVLRVYTKSPHHEPSLEEPVVLPRGSTVEDVAETIHKDIARELRFARIWGSAKFPGQQVPKDYVVQDGDIVELHAVEGTTHG
jgi:small GTP-binding protein